MVDDGNDDDDFVRLVVLLCCCFFFGYIAGGALCLLLLFFVSFTKNSFCCVLQQQQAPVRWTMIMVPSAVSSSIHLSNRWEDSHRCCIVCRSFYSWKERKCFSGSSDISISPLTPPRYQLHEMFPRITDTQLSQKQIDCLFWEPKMMWFSSHLSQLFGCMPNERMGGGAAPAAVASPKRVGGYCVGRYYNLYW